MSRKNQLTTSDHFDYDEYQRFLKMLHNDREYLYETYARLSFCTACRASDVLSLKWSDVIGKSQCVVTERKTGKTRAIPLNESVQGKLLQLYRYLGEPDKSNLIFLNPGTGTAITIQRINQKLKEFKYKYRLSIDHFSTHTFRKTFGRYVYEINNHSAESLLLLNKILNHSNLEATKRYIGITKEEINSVFASIQF